MNTVVTERLLRNATIRPQRAHAPITAAAKARAALSISAAIRYMRRDIGPAIAGSHGEASARTRCGKSQHRLIANRDAYFKRARRIAHVERRMAITMNCSAATSASPGERRATAPCAATTAYLPNADRRRLIWLADSGARSDRLRGSSCIDSLWERNLGRTELKLLILHGRYNPSISRAPWPATALELELRSISARRDGQFRMPT
jgi:hypothetical protein